jgi:hypothetical protein
MNNITFKQAWQKGRPFLLLNLLVLTYSSFVYKYYKLEDNPLNVFLIIVLPQIIFSICFKVIEKVITKWKNESKTS